MADQFQNLFVLSNHLFESLKPRRVHISGYLQTITPQQNVNLRHVIRRSVIAVARLNNDGLKGWRIR
jgi:hypothetical protein